MTASRTCTRVQGHTDSDGDQAYNQWLSEQRATAVTTVLDRIEDISSVPITTEGFGETSLIATNDTAEGRATTRRVELLVHFSGCV